MNREEKITETYLKSLDFKDVIFEPDGNIPPDFSLDGRIAVEVRRLNQHYFSKDKVMGLEVNRIALFDLIESLLKEFDSQYRGDSYWVSVRFNRPIGSKSANRKAIIKALADFLEKPFPIPYHIEVTENIYFSILPREPVSGKVFRYATIIDRESGGFLLHEFKINFDHCVKEKSDKIKDYYHKYNSWWLILVDKIVYSFDEDEKQEIKSMVTVNSVWDKVIVIEAINGKNILEINKSI